MQISADEVKNKVIQGMVDNLYYKDYTDNPEAIFKLIITHIEQKLNYKYDYSSVETLMKNMYDTIVMAILNIKTPKEEEKMINETRKILSKPELKVTATTVRVPVFNSHSVSINIEFEKSFEMSEIFDELSKVENLVIVDDVKNNKYPMPIDATGSDSVFVGRIRRDFSVDNGINLWTVADNVRKGAASNAIQIAEKLFQTK